MKQQSFIPVEPDSHFPIQNLPYGVFRPDKEAAPRIGVAIGEYVVDLSVLDEAGQFATTAAAGKNVFAEPSLNKFMALGRPAWREVRTRLQRLLSEDERRLGMTLPCADRLSYRKAMWRCCSPRKLAIIRIFTLPKSMRRM